MNRAPRRGPLSEFAHCESAWCSNHDDCKFLITMVWQQLDLPYLRHTPTNTNQRYIYDTNVKARKEVLQKPLTHAFATTNVPTAAERHFQHNDCKPPVGLLIDTLAKHEAALGNNLTIQQHHESPILIIIIAPWRHIK